MTIEECKAKCILPTRGTPVRISENIQSPDECRGFFVHKRYIESRRPNEAGTYIDFVPGAGGDVWWIKHDDGSVGAYIDTEINDI